jgi:hypothetical protein
MGSSISLYSNLFYVSMAVACAGFALAVFFFFYFDIPTVRAMMTGRAKQETIRRIEEQNFRTGKIRTNTGNSEKIGKSGKTEKSEKLRKSGKLGHTAKTQKTDTEALNVSAYQNVERLDTSVLSVEAHNTTLLDASEAETVILSKTRENGSAEPAPAPAMVNVIAFHVTDTTLIIHTDEII